jgi:hypothetical protein
VLILKLELLVVEFAVVFHHTTVFVFVCGVIVGISTSQEVACVSPLYTPVNVHDIGSYEDNVELFPFTDHVNTFSGVIVCA